MPTADVLSEILIALYKAPLDPSQWQEFLRLTALGAGGECAALLLHDSSAAESVMSMEWGFHPEVAPLYADHFGAIDVWRSAVTTASDWVGTSEQFVSSSALVKTEFYNDLLLPYEIPHGIFAMVERSPARVANLSICRGARAGAFVEEDLAIVKLLKPHIQCAFRLHSELSAANNRTTGLLNALDALSVAVILVGPLMQVVAMNKAAERIAAEQDGLLVTRAGLHAERVEEADLLAKMLRRAASTKGVDGFSAGGTVLVSRRARPPVQVLISPVRHSSEFDFCGDQPVSAIALVIDSSHKQRPTQDILRALFGLTPAECRVALLLGDGRAPKEIAGMIGVTADTVRSQIKSIFAKTGVNRQTDLVRLLLNHEGLANRPIPRGASLT